LQHIDPNGNKQMIYYCAATTTVRMCICINIYAIYF
jgi:hypothetical protein